MKCKFSDVTHEVEVEVKIDKQVIPKRGCFKYLGSIIQENENINDDSHIVLEWVGELWRFTFGILSDKNVSLKAKVSSIE